MIHSSSFFQTIKTSPAASKTFWRQLGWFEALSKTCFHDKCDVTQKRFFQLKVFFVFFWAIFWQSKHISDSEFITRGQIQCYQTGTKPVLEKSNMNWAKEDIEKSSRKDKRGSLGHLADVFLLFSSYCVTDSDANFVLTEIRPPSLGLYNYW